MNLMSHFCQPPGVSTYASADIVDDFSIIFASRNVPGDNLFSPLPFYNTDAMLETSNFSTGIVVVEDQNDLATDYVIIWTML
ncbi:hypothetical protein [Paenibacillus sp. NPDC058177]|uniref:hypothetical protein n=1 Tax=Paenibacillus sp. NPDC058177 TaxID=3346369 RepID=UPI0036DDF965